MEIKIIEGTFNKADSLALIERIVKTKIQFLEEKIEMTENEEDVKLKEKRIIALQDELSRVREELTNEFCCINSKIEIKTS